MNFIYKQDIETFIEKISKGKHKAKSINILFFLSYIKVQLIIYFT